MNPSEIKVGRTYAGKDPRISLPWPHCCQFRRVVGFGRDKRGRRTVQFVCPGDNVPRREARDWRGSINSFAKWAMFDVTNQEQAQ